MDTDPKTRKRMLKSSKDKRWKSRGSEEEEKKKKISIRKNVQHCMGREMQKK